MVGDSMSAAKLATARLGAPYGVHGLQAVRSYSGDTAHLFRLREVELRERRSGRRRCCTVAEVRQVGDKVIMRFNGVSAREQARDLTGWELWVPRSEASMLQPGEFYAADLCCCTVFQGGRLVGSVTNVFAAGGGDVLEVTDPSAEPFLVPFRELFVPSVDLPARRIELADEFERP
jgi:16S rRNA processing protein RimM